jgi:hypothetical protein
VAVDLDCPPALIAAVRAHPALALVQPRSDSPEAMVDCHPSGAARELPTIRVLARGTSTSAAGPLLWSSTVQVSRRIALDPALLRLSGKLDVKPADTVLLAAATEPLIVRRAGAPPTIEATIDFASARLAQSSELPLLVQFRFDRVLGMDLLDEIALADRGPRAVQVAPVAHAQSHTRERTPIQSQARDLTLPFVLAALAVLLWELAALGRQWLMLRDDSALMPP